MEDAIQRVTHEIAEVREQQRVQSDVYLAVDETASGSEVPTVSAKQEVSPKPGSTLEKGNKREELWPYTEEPHQQSHSGTKTSYDAPKTPHMGEEQAGRQCKRTDTVPIPHQRVEALRKVGSRPVGPRACSAGPQQEGWPVNVTPEQMAYMNAWRSAVVIDQVLRQNMENQRMLLAEMIRSKEELLRVQEEIARDGELEEEVLEQWRVDVEGFFRMREVEERHPVPSFQYKIDLA